MSRSIREALEVVARDAVGVAFVRADGEAFEAHGPVDREEATWIARTLGAPHGSFELSRAGRTGERVVLLDAYEVTTGCALVILRSARALDAARIDRALADLRRLVRGRDDVAADQCSA